MSRTGSQLSITTPTDFHFQQAVTTYGYYVLAPNQWDKQTNTLHRPLRLGNRKLVQTAITLSKRDRKLIVQCNCKLDRSEAATVKQMICRMLRLNEDFSRWRQLHSVARKQGFGRLFRSPTLFEDIVKTITGCNVAWPNTITMNRLLCEHFGEGGFPSVSTLARVKSEKLKALCKVGYRDERIVRLARQVDSGELDLDRLDNSGLSTDELFDEFRAIYGIGEYAANNLLQHVGRYDRLAIDSETYRHFREMTGKPTPKTPGGLKRLHKQIRAHYEPYAPYQFLAYWFELWHGYTDADWNR